MTAPSVPQVPEGDTGYILEAYTANDEAPAGLDRPDCTGVED